VNSAMQLIKVLPGFALTTLILAMVPGQGVAMVLRQSLLGGSRAACYSVFGNSTGLIIWSTLSSLGLSAIFARSHLAYNLLKYAGVAFLVGLAIQTLYSLKNDYGKFDIAGVAKSNPAGAFRLGLITNLTNVKAAVFAVAFVPQFVPKSFSLGWGIFLLGFVWAIVSSSWYVFLIRVVDRASSYLTKPKVRKSLTAMSAIGIIVLAIGLLISHSQ
jgi:threonine/homoserine/homoserine lactone efflux protein